MFTFGSLAQKKILQVKVDSTDCWSIWPENNTAVPILSPLIATVFLFHNCKQANVATFTWTTRTCCMCLQSNPMWGHHLSLFHRGGSSPPAILVCSRRSAMCSAGRMRTERAEWMKGSWTWHKAVRSLVGVRLHTWWVYAVQASCGLYVLEGGLV